MTERRNISPADELGHLRAEIRQLRDREAELKEQIARTGQSSGTDFEVKIVNQTRRTLNRDALPPEILNDDRYWKVSVTRIVKTVAVREQPEDSLIDHDDF